MGFSRQEYWSGLSCPPPGDLPDSGIEPVSLKSHALAGEFFTSSATWRETSSKKAPRAGPQLPLALFPYPVSCRGSSRLTETRLLWISCLYIRSPWGGSKVRRISSVLCLFPGPASGPPVKEHYSRFISLFPFSSTRFPSINLNIGFLCSPHL